MRPDEEKNATVRSSALWTKPGETRSSALWGKGGRGLTGAMALAIALMAPAAGFASSNAVVPSSLRAKAKNNPNKTFNVIVQSDRGYLSSHTAKKVRDQGGSVKLKFKSISGVAAKLSGKELLALSRNNNILSITPDAPMFSMGDLTGGLLDPLLGSSDSSGSGSDSDSSDSDSSGSDSSGSGSSDSGSSDSGSSDSGSSGSGDSSGSGSSGSDSSEPAPAPAPAPETAPAPTENQSAPTFAYTPSPVNGEMWREATHIDALWNYLDPLSGMLAPTPTIAIVDSGVDSSRVEDFGSRVLAEINLSSLSPNATGDDQGHGTMVAGVAAGASPSYPGVAQNAPLVSIRTSDAEGRSVTSDVIAAADWILANKDLYNIRVANFSLAGSVETSFRFDPLDRAVERLWFSGVVVVAAAGNHGSADGADVSMSYAPGNDPFIITVGAVDQQQTADPYDDTVAWWSGKGYTLDGFYKPDMVAPGRYLIMPVPMDATTPAHAPDRVVAPGYMWMSGTSFAAPIVAGAAAELLARHPDWGPDEVKGALMLSAVYLPEMGAGVGEIDASVAASFDFTPPNPNENFYAFVETDPVTGYKFFNEANWASYVSTQRASWSSANWASASWASASWASANWASASWASANWASSVESSMTSTASWNASANAE